MSRSKVEQIVALSLDSLVCFRLMISSVMISNLPLVRARHNMRTPMVLLLKKVRYSQHLYLYYSKDLGKKKETLFLVIHFSKIDARGFFSGGPIATLPSIKYIYPRVIIYRMASKT